MDSKTPARIPELPPDQAAAVAWLRTPQGERWSRARIGFSRRIHRHDLAAGVFADVIPQPAGPVSRTAPDDYR